MPFFALLGAFTFQTQGVQVTCQAPNYPIDPKDIAIASPYSWQRVPSSTQVCFHETGIQKTDGKLWYNVNLPSVLIAKQGDVDLKPDGEIKTGYTLTSKLPDETKIQVPYYYGLLQRPWPLVFPDFRKHICVARQTFADGVRDEFVPMLEPLQLTGNHEDDKRAAQQMLVASKRFSQIALIGIMVDCEFHHHENGVTIQVVKRDAHQAAAHSGSASLWKKLIQEQNVLPNGLPTRNDLLTKTRDDCQWVVCYWKEQLRVETSQGDWKQAEVWREQEAGTKSHVEIVGQPDGGFVLDTTTLGDMKKLFPPQKSVSSHGEAKPVFTVETIYEKLDSGSPYSQSEFREVKVEPHVNHV